MNYFHDSEIPFLFFRIYCLIFLELREVEPKLMHTVEFNIKFRNIFLSLFSVYFRSAIMFHLYTVFLKSGTGRGKQ